MIIKYDTVRKKNILVRFLDASDTYIEKKIKTGRFIFDFIYFCQDLYTASKRLSSASKKVVKIPTQPVKTLTQPLLQIPVAADIVFLAADALHLCRKYFIYYLLVFAAAFPSVLFLFFVFEDNPLFFLLMLPLLLFLNAIQQAILFNLVDKREKNERGSFLNSIEKTFQKLRSLGIIVFLEFLFSCTLIVFFLLFTIIFGTIFLWLKGDVGSSFLYWIIVVPLGLFVTLTIIIFKTTTYQAFFSVAIDNDNPFNAINKGFRLIKLYFPQFFLIYVIISFCFLPLSAWAILSSSEVRLALVAFFFAQSTLFVNYLLRRRALSEHPSFLAPVNNKSSLLLTSFFTNITIFGISAYILFGFSVYKLHSNIEFTLRQAQDDIAISRILVTYHNTQYGYHISYPKTWTIYEFQKNITTFFNNNTGSINGGIWVTVTISPLSQSNFSTLTKAHPGMFINNSQTQESTSKISNITMQTYDGVKYTYQMTLQPYPIYETHYAIKKGTFVYDISFRVKRVDFEDQNAHLFGRIFQSFRFD